jgi:hypothetical protein
MCQVPPGAETHYSLAQITRCISRGSLGCRITKLLMMPQEIESYLGYLPTLSVMSRSLLEVNRSFAPWASQSPPPILLLK